MESQKRETIGINYWCGIACGFGMGLVLFWFTVKVVQVF